MELNLEDLKFKHKNIPCVIVGSGPTMHEFDYENFKGIKIVAGGTILRLRNRFNPDYLIAANNHFPVIEIDKHRDILNEYPNMKYIISDTACYDSIWKKNKKIYNDDLKCDYLFFDDRHYDRKNCAPKKKCCDLLNEYPNREMIYQILEKQFNSPLEAKDRSASVAEFCLLFAIYFGCNPIFIQGVDLPDTTYKVIVQDEPYYGVKDEDADNWDRENLKFLKKKFFLYYFKNLNFKPYFESLIEKIKLRFTKKSIFFPYLKSSIKILKWLSKIAQKNNQKIYVLSKKSVLNKENICEFLDNESLKKKYFDLF